MKYQDITILLVDDDYDHANLFKTNLQRKSITSEVKHFGNSFTLRKHLFDKNIDHKKYTYLMILDINIAGLDCEKLLENIEKEYLLENLTIITLSEAHNRLNESSTLEKGDYASLSKPLIQSVFEETLSNLNIFIHNCKISCTKKLVMTIPDR